MRLCRVLFSQSAASYLIRWSAGCTTNTSEFEFSVHTAAARKAHYVWADIPDELVKRWTAERKRAALAIAKLKDGSLI